MNPAKPGSNAIYYLLNKTSQVISPSIQLHWSNYKTSLPEKCFPGGRTGYEETDTYKPVTTLLCMVFPSLIVLLSKWFSSIRVTI